MDIYGTLENVAMVTIAPELEHTEEVIKDLVGNKVVVSLGK